MRMLLSSFLLSLRRLLRRPALPACLLLLPLMTLALGMLLPGRTDTPVTVGVLLPEGDTRAERLMQGLGSYDEESMQFVQASSRAQLEAQVAGGAWECGYVLPDDFGERLAAGRYENLITRVQSPATTLRPLVDWNVAAALLEICSPDIARNYLAANGITDTDAPAPPEAEIFAPSGAMTVETVPLAGRENPAESASGTLTGAALARGGVALVLLLFACLCAVHFGGDMASGFFLRTRAYTHPAALYFPSFAAAMVLSGAAGGVSLAIAAHFFPGAFGRPAQEMMLLFLYLLYLAAFTFLLSVLFTGRRALVSLLPFFMIACLLFCPILVDLGSYITPLRWVSPLLPPTLYLRAAAGYRGTACRMLPAGAALTAAGVLVGKWKRRHYTGHAAP